MIIRSLTMLAATAALAAALTAQEPPAPAAAAPAAVEQEESKFEVWYPNRPANEADYKVAKWGPRGLPSPGYAFRAAKVVPVTSAPILDGVVVTRNGTIEAVGPAKTTPACEPASRNNERNGTRPGPQSPVDAPSSRRVTRCRSAGNPAKPRPAAGHQVRFRRPFCPAPQA